MLEQSPDRLTLELGQENRGYPCPCCGHRSHLVYGLVYDDGDAHAVYLAGWSEGHVAEGVRMVVSIGDWGEEGGSEDRFCVGLCCVLRGPQVDFHVVEPRLSPWSHFETLGPMLAQSDALTHPYLEAFLDVARRAVAQDERVREFLRETGHPE